MILTLISCNKKLKHKLSFIQLETVTLLKTNNYNIYARMSNFISLFLWSSLVDNAYLRSRFLLITSYWIKSIINGSDGPVVRAFAPWAGGRGFDPRPRHTKSVIKMVTYDSALSAQRIRTCLFFSPVKPRSKTEMGTIWNERSRVINISWDGLFYIRP